MTRFASAVAAAGLLVTVILAITDDDPSPQLGSGDRVPSVAVGLAPVDHVALLDPADMTTTPRRVRAASVSRPVPTGDVWWQLAGCETGYTYDQRATSRTGRYLGFFQFDLGSWRSAGGSGDPRDHSYEQQLAVAQNWQRLVGWGAWPTCSRKLGLR